MLLRGVRPVSAPTVSIADVRRWLAVRLPAHMIPERLVLLPRLPLNSNAKIDRAAVRRLLETAVTKPPAEFTPPEGELEGAVAAVWAELLELEQVGRDQNFFALGGDSLLATRLVEAIRQRWSAAIPLRDFFSAPTVANLAALLDEAHGGQATTAFEEGVL
jgi:dihydroaeruginoic acid synthetase